MNFSRHGGRKCHKNVSAACRCFARMLTLGFCFTLIGNRCGWIFRSRRKVGAENVPDYIGNTHKVMLFLTKIEIKAIK
jgi:hypothetical protein